MKKSQNSRSCWTCRRCCIGIFIFMIVLLFLLLLGAFVVLPLVFKFSVGLQKSLVFVTWQFSWIQDYYGAIEDFNLKGYRNMYVTVDEKDNITLGVYHILPAELLKDGIPNHQYDYDGILENESYNVILYLHGQGGVRPVLHRVYEVLRQSFQILACDYRGYADSSKGEMTEDTVVGDVVNLYKWVQGRTKAKIFIWGHSLGTGIATHTVSALNSEGLVASGLVLEAPFTSFPDTMERFFLAKYFRWLPWFRATFLDPMIDNGFGFESKKHIVNVSCPIMILHAEDDQIIPHELASQLYEIAIHDRNVREQGSVIYYLFEPVGYNHLYIYRVPELPEYIKSFVGVCERFANQRSI